MFTPKSYTILNKIYDPTKDIRKIHNEINEWIDQLNIIVSDVEQYEQIFYTISMFIDYSHFPDGNIPFYKETLEGWKLMKIKNRLKEGYPRQYKQVLFEERKEEKEMLNMLREDKKMIF